MAKQAQATLYGKTLGRAELHAGYTSGEKCFGLADDLLGNARKGEPVENIVRDERGGLVGRIRVDQGRDPPQEIGRQGDGGVERGDDREVATDLAPGEGSRRRAVLGDDGDGPEHDLDRAARAVRARFADGAILTLLGLAGVAGMAAIGSRKRA